MERKGKIGLLLTGLVLSLCTVTAFEPAYSQDEVQANQEVNQDEIKFKRDTLDKAVEFMKNKDFNAALPHLNAYIEAKPKKYQGYKLRGEAYYALRKYDLAVADFQKAVDIKADNDKFATGTKVISAVVLGADRQDQYQNPELGELYGELMYAQKAVNDNMYEVSYKKAMEYNSHQYLPAPKKEEISKINCPQKYGKTFNAQGVDADISAVVEDIEKGKFSEAVYTIPKITSEYPNYYLGHYLSGVVMSGLEQDEEAVSAFNRAISLNPDDFESYASLGLLYYREAEKTFDSKLAAKSVENFQKALKNNPNCNTYYYYIGLNEMLENKYDAAISNFKKAINLKNNDYNSKYYMAVAQYLNKDYKGTIEEATNLLFRRVSNYNSVLYLRALSYYKLKNYEAAIADIEKVHHNMDDIYNLDIKKFTQKEMILETYLYYLQSKISRDNGLGAKSDLLKAYKNPIIALLDTRSKDFEHANYKLTSFDIDNQYDLLRTTFDDLGLDFVYLNPDYKVARKALPTNEPVANKQDETKLAVENSATVASTKNEQILPTDEITVPSQVLVEKPVMVEPENLLQQEDNKTVCEVTEQTEKLAEIVEQKAEEVNEEIPQKVEKTTLEEVKEEALTQSETSSKTTENQVKTQTDKTVEENIAKESRKPVVVDSPTDIEQDKKTVEEDKTEVKETVEKKEEIKDKNPETSPLNNEKSETKTENPAIVVYDADTLIFAPVETPKSAQQYDSYNARIRELMMADSGVKLPSSDTEKDVSLNSKTSDLVEEKEQTVEEKLNSIKETVTQSEKPVITEITETNRIQEVSEPTVDEVKQEEKPLKEEQALVEPEAQTEISTNTVEENQKAAETVEVTSSSKVADTVPTQENSPQIEQVEENVQQAVKKNYVEDVSKTSKSLKVPVNEKFANVNLDEFDVKNLKSPEVHAGEEVIFLDTENESFIERTERQVNENMAKLAQMQELGKTKDKEAVKSEVQPTDSVAVNITPDTHNITSITQKITTPEPTLIDVAEVEIPKTVEEKSENIATAETTETQKVLPEIRGAEVSEVAQKVQQEEDAPKVTVPETQVNEAVSAVVDETVTDTAEDSTVQEPVQAKSKKAKNKKNEENLILAVGENQKDYVQKPEKTKKIKKNKQEKIEEVVQNENTKEEDFLTTSDTQTYENSTVEKIPSTVETVEKEAKTIAKENVTEVVKADQTAQLTEKTDEEASVNQEVKPVKKEKKEKISKKQKAETVESTVTEPQNTVEEVKNEVAEDKSKPEIVTEEKKEMVSTPQQDEEAQVKEENNKVEEESKKVEKPKKQSFFKRLFSRKKNIQVESEENKEN